MINWFTTWFPNDWLTTDAKTAIVCAVAVTACLLVILAINGILDAFKNLIRRR